MTLFVAASYGINIIIISWAAATVGQTDEKKAVTIAMANIFANAANIYTPYIWPKSDAPRYAKAMSASCAFSVGVVAVVWILKWDLKRVNKKIKRDENEVVFTLYAY